MTSPTRVVYTPTSATSAEVSIGGVDISGTLTRFSFDHAAPTEVPKVFLELRGGLDALPEGIDAEAIVHVREVVQEEAADGLLRFIEPLDPAELDKACLAVMEMGGPETYGQAVLHVLRAWARGEQP